VTPLFQTTDKELMGGPVTPPPSMPWVSFRGLYTAHCISSGAEAWLQVDITRTPGDTRPVVGELAGPLWGLHSQELKLAMNKLVSLVRSESKWYAKSVKR